MFVYILKSTVCLVLLLGFYHLVLEKEKMHQFNRFYLLGSVVFSLIVPSFIITVTPTEFAEPILTNQTFNQNILLSTQEIIPVQEIDYSSYILASYIIICTILFLLFGRKLFSLLQKIRKNKKVSYFKATVVLLKEQVLPHTFLNYIFINNEEYQTDSLEQQILTHELTHVEQKHTLDVLFIQILQNLFWFNPIFRFYRKAIQLNHEFLADDAVINSHKNISEYQQLLLSKTAQNNNIYLASNFNYSLTKKRLLMMTTPSSKTKILLKKLLILPLTAGFIFAFAQRVEAQENKDLPQVVEVKKNNIGISDKEMKEYKRLITEAKSIKVFKQKDIIRMQNLYTRMSVKQQNSVEDIFKLLPPPPPVSHQKKTPSKLQFNSWKNKEKYALWIDGKAIDNSELNNYKNTDFSYFIGSKAHNNSKSKRFPQEYQFNLFTHSFFKKMKEKERQENKNVIRIFINKRNNLLVNNKATTIQNLKNVLNNVKVDKNKAHVLISLDKESKEETLLKVKKILKENRFYRISINNKLLPPPPPIDLVYTYNRLGKRINSTSKNRKANVEYLYQLYNKMNASQKRKVKKPSSIVLPPPPPKPVKIKVIEKDSKKKKSRKNNKPVSITVIDKIDKDELVEVIEVEEIEEQPEIIEIKEEIEEAETKVVEEIEEVKEEIIETPEVVEILENEGVVEDEIVNLQNIQKSNIKKEYYINNKKVSERKFNRLNFKKIKKLRIKKGNIYKIYITTKN